MQEKDFITAGQIKPSGLEKNMNGRWNLEMQEYSYKTVTVAVTVSQCLTRSVTVLRGIQLLASIGRIRDSSDLV